MDFTEYPCSLFSLFDRVYMYAFTALYIIMVARSSVTRAKLYHYILRVVFFFFSLATLSQTSQNRHPETFPHDVA